MSRLDKSIRELKDALSAVRLDRRYATSPEVLQNALDQLMVYQRLIDAERRASDALNEALSA